MVSNNSSNTTDDFISLQDLLGLCLAKWHWFVVSLIVTLGIAVVYLLKTPPIYTRSADILIKEDSKGQTFSGEVGSTFADMGLFQSNTNVNNELISLRSPSIMLDVVKRLHLDISYMRDGRFYKETLYGKDLPISVSFEDLRDNESVSLSLYLKKDGSVTLTDFKRDENEFDSVLTGQLGEAIETPAGKLTVKRSPYYDPAFSEPIRIARSSLYGATEAYGGSLTVSLSDEKSTVVTLSYQDVCIQRAEDILNTLIAVYNENWVKDRNQIAVSTSMFINDRLAVIESELGNVDEDISSYKSANLLPDVQAASSLYMTQSSQTSSQILNLNNQLSMARYIRNYVTNTASRTQLLPVNAGLENSNIEGQISEYNSTLLQRNSLVSSSSEQNPLVIDMDQALQAMRDAITTSIDNLMVTLNTQLRTLQQSEQQTTALIAANPSQAKYLLSVERQQKVKESLYLFLLQKREENELSQAFTAYNTRLITPPNGQMIPTSPVKRNILLVAFALGLLIPVVVVFLMENLNTKVRGRKDIANLHAPFIGEIPLSYRMKRHLIFRKKRKEKLEVVVKEKSRNIINEAFRVIRTNLEFVVGKDEKAKVIMLSSANPGSGKTFISMNLASSLAIKGKKVISIDLDLRRRSLSGYINNPTTGISDYLNGAANNLSKIIVKGQTHPNLDILPVGTIPPNPTELLYADRLEQLLTGLREEYDYIFLDCPPIEIVADAAIINKYADLTLFIIRAGLLDRSMLPEIDRLYTEHKYKNISIILNGTDGGGHYGYKYSYHYGYHYGYAGYAKED